jgi:putative acetyltransferase
MNIIIRNEEDSDIEAILQITKAAFQNHPYSHQTEQFIITGLRKANALTISLIAQFGKKVVGHIAFSPVSISDGTIGWYGLGPISVLPEFQRQGIGKSLIREGLSMLKAAGAKVCILVGDSGYYRPLGFENSPDLIIDGVPQENILTFPFDGNKIQGIVTFHEAFASKS